MTYMAKSTQREFRGESEIFDNAHALIEATRELFPNADSEELKLICEAALDVTLSEVMD